MWAHVLEFFFVSQMAWLLSLRDQTHYQSHLLVAVCLCAQYKNTIATFEQVVWTRKGHKISKSDIYFIVMHIYNTILLNLTVQIQHVAGFIIVLYEYPVHVMCMMDAVGLTLTTINGQIKIQIMFLKNPIAWHELKRSGFIQVFFFFNLSIVVIWWCWDYLT